MKDSEWAPKQRVVAYSTQNSNGLWDTMRKRLYIQTSLATTHCHVCSSSFFKTRQPRAVDVINRSNRSASCASSCSAAHTVPLGVCVRPWTENYAQSDAHTHTPRVDQGVIKHSRISTIERTLGDLSHLPRVLARGSGTSVQWWRTAKMMCAAPRGVAYTAPVDLLFELSDLAGARSVGSGTSAVVYAGAWRGLEVAVKVLRGGLCARAEQEAERERSAHARLRHPNIIAFLGSAGVPGGAHALVFQYCQGGSLDVRKLAQAADLAVAIDVALDVARALEHAHTRNVIHRDVKPSQVFLDCCGRALLGDWGLAATVGSAECTVSETGTWEYVRMMHFLCSIFVC